MMKRSLSELYSIKKDTDLATRGAEVLEKMENALNKELLELQKRNAEIENDCIRIMDEIKRELDDAVESGVVADIDDLISSEPLDNQTSIVYKKKFGKLITQLKQPDAIVLKPRWGAPVSYEEARELSKKLLARIVDLGNAQSERAFIQEELAKTRRRVNALRKIIIPDLETRKKSLEEWLDEETREELGRRRWVEDVVSA